MSPKKLLDVSWLSGLIDGEGCFVISARMYKDVRSVECRLSIEMRADDLRVLEEARRVAGCGEISFRPGRNGWNPQAKWAIGSKSDCAKIIVLLTEVPLRSKKIRDFVLWAEAVKLHQLFRGGPGATPHNAPLFSRIVGIQKQLTETRKYKEST